MKILRSQGPMTGYTEETSPCGSAPGSVDCQHGNHQVLELSQEPRCAHHSLCVHSESSSERKDQSALPWGTPTRLVLMKAWQMRKSPLSPSVGWTQGPQAPLQPRADPEFHSKLSTKHVEPEPECCARSAIISEGLSPVIAPKVHICERQPE